MTFPQNSTANNAAKSPTKKPAKKTAAAETSGSLLSVLPACFPGHTKDELLSLVLCGRVRVEGVAVRDHTRGVKKGDLLEIDAEESRFVSRGAHKLLPVLDAWNVEVGGRVWLDAGCSTGGFTEALLSRGAAGVHAVDVGYNVLSYALRGRADVFVHERTNIWDVANLSPQPQRAVVDLSFRSLRGVLKHIISLCSEQYALALCKPQFEFGGYAGAAAEKNQEKDQEKGQGKNPEKKSPKENKIEHKKNPQLFSGVITDAKTRRAIVEQTVRDLEAENLRVHRIMESSVAGRKGNVEFFLEVSA